MNSKRKIIAVVGPTASGKTGIGVRLAREFNGEIISADSRQVYRGLDLGTGKEGVPCGQLSIINYQLSINEQLKNFAIKEFNENWKPARPAGGLKIDHLRQNRRFVDDVPQWLIDIADPGERITLFDWLPLARLAIEDIISRGKLPIVVGGTGLYVQALVEGFVLEKFSNDQLSISNQFENYKINQLNENCQDGHSKSGKLEIGKLDTLSKEELQRILKDMDPSIYSRIDINNRHRLIRAIERAQEGLIPTKVKPDFEVLQIGIDIPRQELYERIDRRVDARFEKGMLEEVDGLIKSGVDPEWLMKLGLEYREIASYLIINQPKVSSDSHSERIEESRSKGSVEMRLAPRSFTGVQDDKRNRIAIKNSPSIDSMKQDLKYKIHQFAKRQMTWFRRFPEINWLSDYDEMKRFVRIFLEH